MQTAFLPYLLQASGCLAVLYLLYRLLLHRETFFAFNRWYLLGSVVLAALLPRVELPAPVTPLYVMPAIPLDAVTLLQESGDAGQFDWMGLLAKGYAAGVVLFAARLLYRLYRLRELARQLPGEPRPGYRLLYTGGRLPTFSFFGWLFWDETEALSEAQQDQVLRHEEAHIRQRHSADVLVLEIAGIFLWFNPFVYLLRREIRAVHEYLADREALRTGDRQAYLQLVAGQALHALRIPLIQPFHAPGFRHRIRMIRRAGAHRPALWRATVCLLVVGMLSLLYACGTGELIDPPPSTVDDNVFVVVEEMPQFPGGMEGLSKYLSESLKYPAEAREKNVQGTVFLSFVVQPDGTVANVRVLKGIEMGCDNEARRVVAQMPAWQPGRQGGKAVAVRYSLPIRFTQDGGKVDAGPSPGVRPPPPPPADDNVFAVVEEMPEFPGGMEGLGKYLMENLRYPAEAREKNVQGTVFLSFVVQADGTITDVTTLRGIGSGCDEEASRVLAAMPPWQPGRQSGKAVPVRYSLPIRFVMD